LDGETIVNQLLERFRIAKESHLSAVDEEDSKESILADLTEAMRSTRSGEMFPIDRLWEMVDADEADSIA
jgi:predicted component of type VI protein secretion system